MRKGGNRKLLMPGLNTVVSNIILIIPKTPTTMDGIHRLSHVK